MADNNITITLKSALEQGRGSLDKLQQAGAFEGAKGSKDLTRIQNLIESLSKVDLANLKGSDLTAFLNNLNKLATLLDNATTGLNNYTDAFKKQLDEVDKARKKLDEARSKKTEALDRKDKAANEINVSDNRFINKKTGHRIYKPDTIADAYTSGNLEIQGPRGGHIDDQEAKAAALGIKQYAAASQEVAQAQIQIDSAQLEVEQAEKKLDETPKGDQIHPVTDDVLNTTAQMRKTTSEVRESADQSTSNSTKVKLEELNKTNVALKEQNSSLGHAFKSFSIYAVAVRSVKKALSEAVNTVKELDKYLTEQAMVTGKTREQTYALVGSYQELAAECGATTKEIAQVATEYMKQGKTIADSMTLTEAAVKAAKVARVSVGDSVNYLTTALNGFQMSAEQAMLVSDKFAAVAAASATDYDELAIALSKVASQANLAGMSIDYTTALLTKGLETTREAPETMGTALKTIIARMRELSDYGETLGGDTDINKVESQLAYVGIALRDSNGELRSTEDVLDELGKKWDSLNKNQQAALAKALAGTRQQSRLIALMDDYERVTELQQISMRSAGATSAQAATYLEGMEAAMNNIRVAWEKLVMNLTNNKLIIGTFQTIGKVIDGIAGLMGNVAAQIPVFTVLGAISLSALGNKMKEMQLAKEQAKLERENALKKAEAVILDMELNRQKYVDEATAQAIKLQNDKETLANNQLITANEEKQAAITAHNLAIDEEAAALAKVQATEKAIALEEEKEKEAENLEIAAQKAVLDQQSLITKLAEIAADENATAADQQNLLDAQAKLTTLEQTYQTQKSASAQMKKDAKDEQNRLNKQLKTEKKVWKNAKEKTKLAKKNVKNAEKNVKLAEENLSLTQKNRKSDEELRAIEEERFDKKLASEKETLNHLQQQGTAMGFLNGLGNVFVGIVQGIGTALSVVASILGVIVALKKIGVNLTTKEGREQTKNLIKAKARLAVEQMKAAFGMASSASQNGPPGWIIALAILAAFGLAMGIAAIAGAFNKKEDDAAENIKALSAEIYKLEESAQALESTADHFENLDNKVLKTKEDIQAMNEDLEKLGESMSEETPDTKNGSEYDKEMAKITDGKSEAEYYAGLTDEEKIDFARQKAELQREEADRKRDEQLKEMQSIGYTIENGKYISAEEHQRHLLETDKEVRDAFYAYNKNQLYDYIDALKEGSDTMDAISDEEALMLEGVTQNLLDNMDAWDAYQYAQNPEKVRELTDQLRSVQVNGKQALSVLEGISDNEDEEISLKEKVQAYQALANSLDDAALAALQLEYAEFEFWSSLSDRALDLLDELNLSNDAINEIYGSYEKLNSILKEELGANALQFSADEFKTMMDSVWASLDDDLSNFEEVLQSTFGDAIGNSTEAWNALVSAIGDNIAVGILDMGQQMDTFNNTVNSFYEKATDWNDMTESERMEFIADNSELFSGEGGAELLKAFESGDYNAIESALSKQMAEDQAEQLEQVRRTLAVEEARVGEDRNEAYIQSLKEYEAYLMDGNNLYKASLELRLEQEEAQLDKYRDYLEEQQEALTDSLEKRKEAYEEYFDAISQNEEDEDYEEEADRLINNISKLASSTNADAMQKTAELEKELEELEEERLNTLRERAQEAVIENMDKTIEEINEKFDKLLDSNQALLLALQGELDNPLEFMTDMIMSKADTGLTALQMEEFLQELQGTYGSVIGNDVFENMSVHEENGQLILNVNGQEVILSQGDEESVYKAVMDALRAVGLK